MEVADDRRHGKDKLLPKEDIQALQSLLGDMHWVVECNQIAPDEEPDYWELAAARGLNIKEQAGRAIVERLLTKQPHIPESSYLVGLLTDNDTFATGGVARAIHIVYEGRITEQLAEHMLEVAQHVAAALGNK